MGDAQGLGALDRRNVRWHMHVQSQWAPTTKFSVVDVVIFIRVPRKMSGARLTGRALSMHILGGRCYGALVRCGRLSYGLSHRGF